MRVKLVEEADVTKSAKNQRMVIFVVDNKYVPLFKDYFTEECRQQEHYVVV